MFKKLKTCFVSSLVLTSICVLMYVSCVLFAFDTPIAYFSANSPLPYIAKYLLIFSSVGVGALFFLIPKGSIPCPTPPQHSIYSRISSAVIAVCLLISIILRFSISSNGYLQPTKLFFACAGLASLATIFYLMTAISPHSQSAKRAILQVAAILWAASAMTEAYTNPYVTMNSPFKILLLLSMMSIMFFSLYEARFLITRPYPRAYAVSVLVGTCLSSVFSVSFLVMQLSGKYSIIEFLPTAIVSLAFSVYEFCRALDFLRHLSSEESSQNTVPDNI